MFVVVLLHKYSVGYNTSSGENPHNGYSASGASPMIIMLVMTQVVVMVHVMDTTSSGESSDYSVGWNICSGENPRAYSVGWITQVVVRIHVIIVLDEHM